MTDCGCDDIELTEKEMDAVQRLADRFNLATDDVIETLISAAIQKERGL
jgi:hypothetical protein